MTSETKNKWLKFLGGFVGWFLVSTLVFAAGQMGAGGCLWVLYLLINVVIIVALAVRKPTQWISLGIVSAIAVNFFVALMLRPIYEAVCFFPVTYPNSPARTVTQPTPTNHLPVGYDGQMFLLTKPHRRILAISIAGMTQLKSPKRFFLCLNP